jgi:site-specific recombinase XerD
METAGGFSGLLRGFRLALSVEGLRTSTVEHYVRDAQRFAAHVDHRSPRSITTADLRAYLVGFQADHAPKTIREAQLALRRFFRFLLQEGEIRRDPTSDMKLVACRVDPQPTYTEVEVKRLLLVCDTKTLEGIRNRALLLTLFDAGVREGELVSMGLPDWERRRVTVEGKTGVRAVPLGIATLQALERYARRWGISEPPLWRGKKGPLTGSGVLQVVRRLCRQAGVPQKGVHAFRRAAVAQMKRLGMNDSDILEVAGWRSVEILRRYTAAVAEELAQRAHRRYSPGDALKMG